jgi:hypothetical protein
LQNTDSQTLNLSNNQSSNGNWYVRAKVKKREGKFLSLFYNLHTFLIYIKKLSKVDYLEWLKLNKTILFLLELN